MSYSPAIDRLRWAAGVAILLAFPVLPASAAALVEGTYDVTVGGWSVGVGGFKATLADRSYSATVTVKLTGIARFMSDGRGSATSVGSMAGGHPIPVNYSLSTSSGQYTQTIRMNMLAGAVRMVSISPPPRTRGDVVPVTMVHRRGVMDPVGALVIPVPGGGELLSPAACARTLPVFDGRQRFDIRLSYARMDKVSAPDKSYVGPVVVCRATYQPVAGHRPRPVQGKEMQAGTAAELWLAPVNGTRVLVPWKISVRTPSGQAVIEARGLKMRGTTAAPVVEEEPTPEIRRAERRQAPKAQRADAVAEPSAAKSEPPAAKQEEPAAAQPEPATESAPELRSGLPPDAPTPSQP